LTIWSILVFAEKKDFILDSIYAKRIKFAQSYIASGAVLKVRSLPPQNAKTTIRSDNEATILAAAEAVFAEFGFKGATTAEIARRAQVPKANLHYYFSTKEALYRVVLERVLTTWLNAADSLDQNDEPDVALARYIGAKMDLSRTMPLSSQIWASEIMRGAPVIQDFLETTLADWVAAHELVVRRWMEEGKIHAMTPRVLFFMIWATTQHYADFAAQIATLNGGQPLSDEEFETAKAQVTQIILRGIVKNPQSAQS
jgi:TetR/AcrR family transcriptional regulator